MATERIRNGSHMYTWMRRWRGESKTKKEVREEARKNESETVSGRREDRRRKKEG